MSKTRETTPEVELLKSPSTIYKEFCESDTSDSDEIVQIASKNAKSNSLAVQSADSNSERVANISDGEEEITIFSRKNSEPDILEFWDNDLEMCPHKDCESMNNVDKVGKCHTDADHCECAKCKCDKVNRTNNGDEVLEVYDSKYGKNEDFITLQKEVRDKHNANNNCKHGQLPYRAVCCSLM